MTKENKGNVINAGISANNVKKTNERKGKKNGKKYIKVYIYIYTISGV